MTGLDPKSERTVLFGPFRLFISKRLLCDGDRMVRLGSRAMEILIALVERAGELVSKRELVKIVWPDTTVVEANLTVHVAALRRALGDGEGANQYIVNSPGRGYRFVAPIRLIEGQHSTAEAMGASSNSHNLPAQLTRLVGRTGELACLRSKMDTTRLLSIVGAPGMGKTSIVLNLAESLLPKFRHGVWLVDLASVANGSLVPSALTSALPIDVRATDILSGIAGALRYKQILLVFDNCEHVIEGVAAAVSTLLQSAPDVSIITTSREPLRIEGEQVFRLAGLETPPAASAGNGDRVLDYPAVQLFVERARAIADNFELSDADRDFAARICRSLDGNPLAIELAAARVDAFGVRDLAERIEDRNHLLSETHRGTPPRHRSIAAAIDWSYKLLTDEEQFTLNCLAIFSGNFTLDAAVAIVPKGEALDTASIIANLVCKSLLSSDVGTGEMRFRLLEITKAFALAKLLESSRRDELADRLRAYLIQLLRGDADGSHRVEFLRGTALQELDNIRGVLAWAFAPGGRAAAGIELAARAVPIWLENSLLTECIAWTGKAIEALEHGYGTECHEMILQAALGLSTMFTEGMTSRSRGALNRSIELAQQLGDIRWELRARLGLVLFLHRSGDLKGALLGTERVERLAAGTQEPGVQAMMKSVKSASLFFNAEYAPASKLAGEAHEYFRVHRGVSQIGRWGLNHSVYAQCVIARVHWHQGWFDRTVQACLSAHAEAEATGNPTSICQALSWCGCPLFLTLEQLDLAAESIQRFRQVAEDNNIQSYLFSALGYEGRLLFLRGDIASGERCLREALSKLSIAQYKNLYTPFLGRLAELLLADGRSEEALLASTEALERTRATEALWLLPYALAVQGEILASLQGPKSASAEAHLRESIELSVRQDDLGWELRAAEGFAKFLQQQDRTDEASILLAKTLGRFREGFNTVPFRRAQALLGKLQTAGSLHEELDDRRSCNR